MSVYSLLLIVLLLVVLGALPGLGPIHHGLGYAPSLVGVVLLVVVIVLLFR